MNFTTFVKIKARLQTIIDQLLYEYAIKSQSNQFALDESKLQQWGYMLKQIIIQKQNTIQSINTNNTEQKNQILKKQIKIFLPHLRLQQRKQLSQNRVKLFEDNNNILQRNQKNTKIIEILNSNKLILYQIDINYKNNQNKKLNYQFSPFSHISTKQFEFPATTLKKFSSITQITANKFIIAGGCHYQNPNIKSSHISIFQTNTGDIKKIGSLLQPLSSHSCVYIEPKVYFIGGKKINGIITKMCSYYDIYKKQTVQISALNYACASMCTIQWKQKYLYKIGGIGECFGQFNLSPYIQRYDIIQDIWEVINPLISQNIMKTFSNFQLYAQSMAYITDLNELVIFGGFDMNKKGTNFGCVIQIKQIIQNKQGKQKGDEKQSYITQNQLQNEDIHEIIKFGAVQGLDKGGYGSTQMIIINQNLIKEKQKNNFNRTNSKMINNQQIYSLQTVMNGSPRTQLIRIPTKFE